MSIEISATTEVVKVNGEVIDIYDYQDSMEEFMEWALENFPGQTTVTISNSRKDSSDIVEIADRLAGFEGIEAMVAHKTGKITF